MPSGYEAITARGDASALMPEEHSDAILKKLETESAAMALFPHIPMGKKQTRLPVLAGVASAYFVNGDTGLAKTTKTKWGNKYLNAEPLACIVPVPKSVLDDEDYDMWATIEPLARAAIARTLDGAIMFGTNKPANWGTDLWTGIGNYNAKVIRGTATQAQGGVAEDVNNVMGLVETSGFNPTGHICENTFKATLRRQRDTLGQKLLDVSANEVEGLPVKYYMPGLWDHTSGMPEMITGDFSEGMLGIRKDIEVSMLDQAVIQDDTGAIIYNLAQQGMVALMLTCRFAWEVANTINWNKTSADGSDRFPFAALVKP